MRESHYAGLTANGAVTMSSIQDRIRRLQSGDDAAGPAVPTGAVAAAKARLASDGGSGAGVAALAGKFANVGVDEELTRVRAGGVREMARVREEGGAGGVGNRVGLFEKGKEEAVTGGAIEAKVAGFEGGVAVRGAKGALEAAGREGVGRVGMAEGGVGGKLGMWEGGEEVTGDRLGGRLSAFESAGAEPAAAAKSESAVDNRRNVFEAAKKVKEPVPDSAVEDATPALESRLAAFQNPAPETAVVEEAKQAPAIGNRLAAFQSAASSAVPEAAVVEERTPGPTLGNRRSAFEKAAPEAQAPAKGEESCQPTGLANRLATFEKASSAGPETNKKEDGPTLSNRASMFERAGNDAVAPEPKKRSPSAPAPVERSEVKVVPLKEELAGVQRTNEELVSTLLQLMAGFKELEKTRDVMQRRIHELEAKARK